MFKKDKDAIALQKYWLFMSVGYKYRLIVKKNPRIFFRDKMIR